MPAAPEAQAGRLLRLLLLWDGALSAGTGREALLPLAFAILSSHRLKALSADGSVHPAARLCTLGEGWSGVVNEEGLVGVTTNLPMGARVHSCLRT